MCGRCNSRDFTSSTTPFTLDFEGRLIVVREVPCKRCLYCDDVVFEDNVASKLESIVNNLKKSKQEVSIVNFASFAA